MTDELSTRTTRTLSAPGAARRRGGFEDDPTLQREVRSADGVSRLVATFEGCERAVRAGRDSRTVVGARAGEYERTLEAVAAFRGEDTIARPLPLALDQRLLVVLPTYNERENLAPMVRAIRAHLACDVLVVDDGSPDGTGALADGLAADHPEVHVLHRTQKQGLGRAYLAGFAWGLERGYDRLFEIDCDFSHAPWDLPRLAWAGQDADLVIGARYVPGGGTEGWTASRRTLSTCANLYTRFFLGWDVHDWTAGFRCYSAELLRRIDFDTIAASGYSFQIEMTWRSKRAGARVVELPIRFCDREAGVSKMSSAIAREALRLVPLMRFRG
ncbi:MAG: polyprenol monophosphomannose synthase [Planctomycetes bacterium]|nr:polyprenol monophosphomannose synthase [Planctomycetota bacterium]